MATTDTVRLGTPLAHHVLDEVLAGVGPGALVGIGGTALTAKPLALLAAMCGRGLERVDVLAYAAGLDAELLLAHDRVGRLRSAYVGLERCGTLPARGGLTGERFLAETFGSVVWGLEATTRGLPFLPGPDLSATGLAAERELRSIVCPFTGATLTAWPALAPDLAVLHARAVTPDGYVLLDADLGVDRLLAKASRRLVVSVEVEAVDAAELPGLHLTVPRSRPVVLLAPGGAAPGGYGLSYGPDLPAIEAYAALEPELRRAWWSDRFDAGESE